MLWEHSCWQQIGLLLSPSDRAEFKEKAASWHAGTPNSWKGPVIYSQCASTHTGNMSRLARCLKPLIRFSVYQSEVMLLQRALTAIEKQPRFKKKSSRMTFFFRLNTLAEEHAHVQLSVSLGFVCFFFPHQTPAWCKWLHVLPIAQHLVLCKSKDVRPKQNHRRLWYNHPACRSTEKRRMCFLYSKKK